MDLQSIISNAVQAYRNEEMKTSPQLMLGELLILLEQVSNKKLPVKFSSGKKPTKLSSWRGSYREIAFQYDDSADSPCPSVEDIINQIKNSIGSKFEGYKGGEFLMGKTTPVWVSQWGQSSREAPVSVSCTDEMVTIETKEIEY